MKIKNLLTRPKVLFVIAFALTLAVSSYVSYAAYVYGFTCTYTQCGGVIKLKADGTILGCAQSPMGYCMGDCYTCDGTNDARICIWTANQSGDACYLNGGSAPCGNTWMTICEGLWGSCTCSVEDQYETAEQCYWPTCSPTI